MGTPSDSTIYLTTPSPTFSRTAHCSDSRGNDYRHVLLPVDWSDGPKHAGKPESGRMGQYGTGIPQLLWLAGSDSLVLPHHGKFRLAGIPCARLPYPLRPQVDAGVHGKPMEVVFRHYAGDDMVLGDIRQVPSAFHGLIGIQSWR